MKSWIFTFLLLLLSSRVEGQSVRLGVVMDPARTILAKAWNDTDAKQNERAYCANKGQWYVSAHWSDSTETVKDTLIRVMFVEEVLTADADNTSISFDCAPGSIELHVHPPTSCAGNNQNWCQLGGIGAYQCQPSRKDLEKLIKRGDPFAIIQCDRWTYRFYYPFELHN